MGYYKEKAKYEQGVVFNQSFNPAQNPNLSEKERERYLVFQEEYGKIDKVGAIAEVIFGGFTVCFLIGIPFLIIGAKKLQKIRNEAWGKAVKRIPYTHEKKR